ncbi:MAG: riboflavin biosynthesis protein RibD [Rubrivivax sp.]
MTDLDDARLARAFQCAEQSIGLSDPNPRVGCVIGSQDGTILAEGWTQAAGQAHAEVAALADARRRGVDVRGATAWVTLEPCSHHGRTPPCCDALIEAGIARVVVAALDPNPEVHGRGMARLRRAGLQVDLAGDAQAERCRELNIGFFSRMTRGRAWVRMKLAISLDGRTALPDGRSQWITSEQARSDGHSWRARSGAILTGIGTVLADDPTLNVRGRAVQGQPLCAVVDTRARLPLQAKLFQPARPVIVYTQAQADASRLEARGASIRRCPTAPAGLALDAAIADLSAREINEIHVEAGPTLCGSLVAQGLVDELLVYLAPTLLGPGREALSLPVRAQLPEAPDFAFSSVSPFGPDLRLILRKKPG